MLLKKKNENVFRAPITRVTPDKKSKFPTASSPLSKSIKTPRKVKKKHQTLLVQRQFFANHLAL